ncbi:MAG: acyl-CoA dehydrogenase family protein [candidate division WOR-3 bacterium]
MIKRKPSELLEEFGFDVDEKVREYESWWFEEGYKISYMVDRLGTPHLRMFDRFGNRIDEILYPKEYWDMLYKGYEYGIIADVFEKNSLMPFFIMGYITSFFDPGLYCPYTVSLSTAVPISKYAPKEVRDKYLPHMLKRNIDVWQGATWMTEVKGGSDLGNTVETVAELRNGKWILNGEKYFASNVGAELAVVAARIKGKQKGVKSLALFLLPKYRENGEINYFVRRLKDKIGTRSVPTGEVELRDSEAYLLGSEDVGIYLILEVLNISRVANSVGSVALMHRAIWEAYEFASKRFAFGKYVIDHPLMKRQIVDNYEKLKKAFALAFEAAKLLDKVYLEKPPYSHDYHMFRLLAHLSKFWTAELAVQTSKWAMEVNGGMGVLAEYPVERLLREAMILPIWEGTPHRQVLDAIEVIVKKDAHLFIYEYLREHDRLSEEILNIGREIKEMENDKREEVADIYISELADIVAEILLKKCRYSREIAE